MVIEAGGTIRVSGTDNCRFCRISLFRLLLEVDAEMFFLKPLEYRGNRNGYF